MPTRPERLYLHEELLLLILQDQSGKTDSRACLYQYALAAGLVAELLMQERIATEGPKQLVNVVNERRTGDELLDDCLGRLAAYRRRKRLRDWVMSLANLKNLKHRIAARLVKFGILEQTEGKVLFIFTRTLYPERDHRPEQEIVERLRDAIFGHGHDVDARTAVLVSLANGTNLLKLHFDRKELRGRKDRLAALAAGDAVGPAARAAIQGAQAAIMVATMVPAIAATAGAH